MFAKTSRIRPASVSKAGKTVQVLAFFIASGSLGSVDAKNQVSDTTFGGAVALI
jgi:hypothetical protein